MYHRGIDGVLCLCIEPLEKPHYLTSAHVTIGGIHMAGDQMLRRVLWAGVWWPTMKAKVYDFVRTCNACHPKPPHPHATLFQVSIAPKRLVELDERPLNLNQKNMS